MGGGQGEVNDMIYTHIEMADIFEGAASSRRQFIEAHRAKKDRPEVWFQQQSRELDAFTQAAGDYRRAANREKAA